jgi:hypothetical protein
MKESLDSGPISCNVYDMLKRLIVTHTFLVMPLRCKAFVFLETLNHPSLGSLLFCRFIICHLRNLKNAPSVFPKFILHLQSLRGSGGSKARASIN